MSRTVKRVAYLCFHVAGRDVELPVFRKLGYEVYTIKRFDAAHRSGAFDFADDRHLTLPQEVVSYLNQVNLVDPGEWPAHAVKYLNQHFDAIFCIQNSHVVYQALQKFTGQVIVRLAGLDVPKTYTSHFNTNQDLLPKLYQNRHRVWFSIQYENLPAVEDPIFAERAIFMPLGIPQAFKAKADTWTGRGGKIVSVIPWIHAPYYAEKYKRAKMIVGDRPLEILGSQKKQIPDPAVAGFLDADEYIRRFQDAAVLLYDSHEPRHVHYPPFEAATIGTPVVFFEPSLLADLGRAPLHGACKSIHEMRDKLDRLLADDRDFIDRVRRSQRSLLEKFADDYVEREWRKALACVDEAIERSRAAPAQRRRIRSMSLRDFKSGGLGVLKHGPAQFTTDEVEGLPVQKNLVWVEALCLGDASRTLVKQAQLQDCSGTLSRGERFASERLAEYNGEAVESSLWAFPVNGNFNPRASKAFVFETAGPQAGNVEFIGVRIAAGALGSGETLRLSKEARWSAPALWDGFDSGNEHGVDLDRPVGRLMFAANGDFETATTLQLTVDRYDWDRAYEAVISLNGFVLAVVQRDGLRNALTFDVQGRLRRMNILSFRTQSGGGTPPEGQPTVHVSALQFR